MINRIAKAEIEDALTDTPVVLIHGPRQCGKSTLAKSFTDETRRYITFDNPLYLEQATVDPLRFLTDFSGPVVLDEVQRVPSLFLPLKLLVDEDRTPGRFILTGSANVLSLPKIADSLAGRMAIVDLLPFTQSETEGWLPNLVEDLFIGRIPVKPAPVSDEDLFRRITVGGFPEANTRKSSASRERWFEDYLRSIIERDIRDIANIDALAQIPKILRLLAARSGSTLNVANLSRDTGIPNTTLHRYLEILEAIFLVHDFPTWSNNRGSRVTKSPKTFLVDSGLLCQLDNVTPSMLNRDRERLGSVLESFVAMELKKLARFADRRPIVHHLRTVKQLEVDFILEARGGDVVGIEVKAAKSISSADIKGLRFLDDLTEGKLKLGVVLYCGDAVEQLAGKIWAVPVSALWS
ncbi:MAG: ATP-binding protein [Chlorobia bacterium]|nr:ATP-binding protein [Fimbriimonadaceae bacterium]